MNVNCIVGHDKTTVTSFPDMQRHPRSDCRDCHKTPEPVTVEISRTKEKLSLPVAHCHQTEDKTHSSVSDHPHDNSTETNFREDLEFDFLKAPPITRSSSLKSKKTPPGTPTRRKSVRFADALGLDLELVRHILNPDEPPTISSGSLTCPHLDSPFRPNFVSYWQVCFPQPIVYHRLTDRVLENKVLLENCVVCNTTRKLTGTVRVANIAYEKTVTVRYTFNGWLTHEDVPAFYIEHSNDLITDRFAFSLKIPEHLVARSRMEFALMFSARNEVYWDNNYNKNYTLECVEYRTP